MNGMCQRPDCSVFHPIWLFHPRRGRQRGLLTLWVVLFPFAKRNARSAIQTVAAANQRPPAWASATAQALSSLPFLSPPFHPPPQANDAVLIVAHPSTCKTRPSLGSRPAALPGVGSRARRPPTGPPCGWECIVTPCERLSRRRSRLEMEGVLTCAGIW